MRAFGLAIGAAVLVATQTLAAENRLDRSLMMLAPSERLEQLCDFTAMTRIRKDSSAFRPDRAVANATTSPQTRDDDTIIAKGAAFRSRGKWYALAFVCKGAPDHMSVLTFNYTIGSEIPEAKWASDNLWQ
jgi:hypothetical protein